MNEALKNALATLDPDRDDHWTNDGLPLVNVVAAMVTDGTEVTRQTITDLAPNFTREAWREQKAALESASSNQAAPAADQAEPETEPAPDPEPELPAAAEAPQLSEQERMAAELDAEAAEVTALIQGKQKDIEAAKVEIRTLEQRHSEIMHKRNIVLPPKTNTEATRDYIESQTQLRRERVEKRNAALAGLKPEDLRKGSPLDEAHARRRQRGTKRPQRQAMA